MNTKKILLGPVVSAFWFFQFFLAKAQTIPLDPIWRPFMITSDIDRVTHRVVGESNEFYSREIILDSLSKMVISNKVYKTDLNFNKIDSIDLLSLCPGQETMASMRLNGTKLELLNYHFVFSKKIQEFTATTIDANSFQVESSNTFALVDSMYFLPIEPILHSDGDWVISFRKADAFLGWDYPSQVGLIKFDQNGTVKKYRYFGFVEDGYGPLIEMPDHHLVLSGHNKVNFLDGEFGLTGSFICDNNFGYGTASLAKGGISSDSSTVFLGFYHVRTYIDAQGNVLPDEHYDRLVTVRNGQHEIFTYPVQITDYRNDFLGRTMTTSGNQAYFGANYYALSDTCPYFSIFTINKVDTLGNLIWQKRFGTDHYIAASEYHTMPNGNILVMIGKYYFADPVIGLGLRGTDYYYLIIDPNGDAVSSSEPVSSAQNDGYQVYPNPAGAFLTIENRAGQGRFEVRISDVFGKTVLAQSVFSKKEIDLKGLATGAYFVQIFEAGQLVHAEKILKE